MVFPEFTGHSHERDVSRQLLPKSNLITRVPKLFDEMKTDKINDFGVPILRDATLKIDTARRFLSQPVQVPALFNFKKTAGAIVDLSR